LIQTPQLVAGLEIAQPVAADTGDQILIAGGTDLYVQRPEELPVAAVRVMQIECARPVWEEEDHIYLSGTATAEDMKRSEILDQAVGGIERAMRLMGSLPIRQRATIAGNIVNASPIGDMTMILLALDAELGLADGSKHRSLALQEFFLGYKELDLEPGELVEWVRFQTPPDGTFFNFEKVSKRTHLDIASGNISAAFQVQDDRILRACLSAGGVAPIPMQLPGTAEFCTGRTPNADTARGAAEVARSEVSPITDVRGTAEYKSLLLGQLVLAHFHHLFGIETGLIVEATA
jgi:xanthine dehydrogenase small subunit